MKIDKALTHTSETRGEETPWGDVDKRMLPLTAFVWQASGTDEDDDATWRYPHHEVVGGEVTDDQGRYIDGDMYLSVSGLAAAWSAAMGGRTGERAEQSIIDHLSEHRADLGIEDDAEEDAEDLETEKAIGAPAVHTTDRIKRLKTNVESYARHTIFTPFDYAKMAKVKGIKVDKAGKGGYVEGYSSVFGVIDHDSEIMERGCYDKTLKGRVGEKVKRPIPLLCAHAAWSGRALDVIGKMIEANEDEYGLYSKFQMGRTMNATDAKTLIDDGMVDGLSVGFLPVRWETMLDKANEREIRRWLEVNLLEVTLTPFPCCETAGITASKALEKFEQRLKALGAYVQDPSPELVEKASALVREEFGAPESVDALAASVAKIKALLEVRVASDSDREDSGKDKPAPLTDRTALLRKARLIAAQVKTLGV